MIIRRIAVEVATFVPFRAGADESEQDEMVHSSHFPIYVRPVVAARVELGLLHIRNNPVLVHDSSFERFFSVLNIHRVVLS